MVMAEANVVMKMDSKKEAAAAVQPMQVQVRGRLEKSRLYEGKRYSQIITPAPDAYSRPQIVEVRSKGRLGDIGEEVSVSCVLGGFSRKPYKVTDKQTGEMVTVTPVDHTLDVVDSGTD
jgi:hypothetical protein